MHTDLLEVTPSRFLASVPRWPSGGKGFSQIGVLLKWTHLKAHQHGPTSFPVVLRGFS